MEVQNVTNKPVDRKKRNQGMNWLPQWRRLAIYLRDGLACCYCGSTVEDDTKFTLDHLIPHCEGGSNETENLVTCCHKCNSSRGNRPVEVFAQATANYLNHGMTQAHIMAHIQACVTRPIDAKAAKELIDRRGSCFAVLNEYRQ